MDILRHVFAPESFGKRRKKELDRVAFLARSLTASGVLDNFCKNGFCIILWKSCNLSLGKKGCRTMIKLLKNCSYRVQIFILCVLVIVFPSTILGIFITNQTLQQVDTKYQESLLDLTTQINMSLDRSIRSAESLSTIHILNNDVRKILTTDFSKSLSDYYPGVQTMQAQIAQANLLNTDVIVAMFINKYGYVFDYNFNTYSDYRNIFDNIDEWAELARQSSRSTYVAPIWQSKRTGIAYSNILPIVKILKDPDDFSEIGVFGVGINFDSVTEIISSSQLSTSVIILFNENDEPFYSSDEQVLSEEHGEFLAELQTCSREVTEKDDSFFCHIDVGGYDYSVNTVYNSVTGWKIVHVLDNSIVTEASRTNLQSLALVFCAVALLALLLAFYISQQLSKSILSLCKQIDACEGGTIPQINLTTQLLSNKDFNQIVNSYNRLNQRLTESLRENYTIQLNEKQMRLRMLQAQINPHFLYNTLNLISSIANIRDVPEIRTISDAISDLLRYNLKSGPIVRLKEEIEQIGRYITIQQIRFPDRFVYECILPRELEDIAVPVCILQPLVENIVVHGFDEKESGGSILINCYTNQQTLHILVADNGSGIAPEKLEQIQQSLQSSAIMEIRTPSGSSIGLLNVHQRIQAFCGKEYGMTIDSQQGQGSVVHLRLPINGEFPSLQ